MSSNFVSSLKIARKLLLLYREKNSVHSVIRLVSKANSSGYRLRG